MKKPSLTLPHPLPEPLVDIIARRFRALSEPTRIRLLDRLRDGEASVHELTAATGASQQNVSKHLAILLDAGIVGRRKEGTLSQYSITDDAVLSLCETVCGSVQKQVAELRGLLEVTQ